MTKANGGFPPITYCKDKNVSNTESSETPNNKTSNRERLFTTHSKKNINIREILNTKENKLVIDLNPNNDELEIVDEI